MLLHALYERLCMAPLNRLPCYGALEVFVTLLLLLLFTHSLTHLTPCVSSLVVNVLVKSASDVNQPPFHFINAVDLSGKDIPAWSSVSDSQLGRGIDCLEVSNPAE